MCHLAIEKAFKAVVCEETNKVPPKTHDLIYLVNIGMIKLPDVLLDFIGIINNAGTVTRYPEDLSKMVSSYPKSITSEYLKKTIEVIKCIRKDSRLKGR